MIFIWMNLFLKFEVKKQMRINRIMSMVRSEYVFSVLTKITMLAIGVLHSAFLARFLGAELKGVAATITSSVALSHVVITCGIHQAYPYFKKQGKTANFTDMFINNVYFVYALLFTVTVIGAVLCYDVFAQKYVYIMILTPIFAYENIVSYVYLIEKPRNKNFWSLCSSVVETLIIIALWLFVKPNDVYMVIAISAAVLMRAVVASVGLKIKLNPKLISISFIIKMFRFGFLPMIALILTVMNSRIDILMMDWNNSVASASIGLYSVGVGISDKILAIPDAIREILLSKLVSGKSEQEVARVTRLSAFFCIVMSVLIALLGKIILHILYGEEYLESYSVLVISSFGTVFMVFLKMISQYNIVNKRQVANMFMLALSVVTNVCLNLILIPTYGIEGAAVASFCGHFVCAVCFAFYFTKATDVKLSDIMIPKKEDFGMLLRRKK